MPQKAQRRLHSAVSGNLATPGVARANFTCILAAPAFPGHYVFRKERKPIDSGSFFGKD
jgi:hypothetical protein